MNKLTVFIIGCIIGIVITIAINTFLDYIISDQDDCEATIQEMLERQGGSYGET